MHELSLLCASMHCRVLSSTELDGITAAIMVDEALQSGRALESTSEPNFRKVGQSTTGPRRSRNSRRPGTSISSSSRGENLRDDASWTSIASGVRCEALDPIELPRGLEGPTDVDRVARLEDVGPGRGPLLVVRSDTHPAGPSVWPLAQIYPEWRRPGLLVVGPPRGTAWADCDDCARPDRR